MTVNSYMSSKISFRVRFIVIRIESDGNIVLIEFRYVLSFYRNNHIFFNLTNYKPDAIRYFVFICKDVTSLLYIEPFHINYSQLKIDIITNHRLITHLTHNQTYLTYHYSLSAKAILILNSSFCIPNFKLISSSHHQPVT